MAGVWPMVLGKFHLRPLLWGLGCQQRQEPRSPRCPGLRQPVASAGGEPSLASTSQVPSATESLACPCASQAVSWPQPLLPSLGSFGFDCPVLTSARAGWGSGWSQQARLTAGELPKRRWGGGRSKGSWPTLAWPCVCPP